MEAEPDLSLVLQPCRSACPYLDVHPDLDPPEDCTGPSTLNSIMRGKVLFCWLVEQEVSETGEAIELELPPPVEEVRRMDPARWQELYDEYLDTLVKTEVVKIKMVADQAYTPHDAEYVRHRTVDQIAQDMKVNVLTGEGLEDERFQYLTDLRVGFEYYPNVEPFKRRNRTWEEALKQYYVVRYPRAKGIASAMLRKEIERNLFEQLDDDR